MGDISASISNEGSSQSVFSLEDAIVYTTPESNSTQLTSFFENVYQLCEDRCLLSSGFSLDTAKRTNDYLSAAYVTDAQSYFYIDSVTSRLCYDVNVCNRIALGSMVRSSVTITNQCHLAPKIDCSNTYVFTQAGTTAALPSSSSSFLWIPLVFLLLCLTLAFAHLWTRHRRLQQVVKLTHTLERAVQPPHPSKTSLMEV